MTQRIRKTRADSGFTLIELLIVIIILGILAAIVVFAVGSTRKDAVSSACKTDVKSIQLAAEAVMTKDGKYPANQAGFLATATTTGGQVLKAWPGGTSATADDLVFTYAAVTATTRTGYTLTVDGKTIKNGPAVLTQDAADGPAATTGTVEYACTSS